jgi:hypothetical protein
MRPIAPDYTDRARALAGTSPAELAPGQRRDLARALIAADLERTQWLPCAFSPGAQAPGGRSANTMRLGCQPAATLFPAEPTAESPRVTLAPLGATIKLSRDGESAVTITPFGIAGHIPIPGLGGPSRATRARNAAVDAENRRILARIRDRTRRRTDSLSWIAESTRAARDSVARATAKPPG